MPRKWPTLSPVYSKARANAKRRGLEFTLTEKDFAALVDRAAGACMLTAIPFDAGYRDDTRFRPYAPSLDRIDSAKGYTPGNVRLVISAVNIALGQWGTPLLDQIARAIAEGEIRELRRENALLRARLELREEDAPSRGTVYLRRDGRWQYSVYGPKRPDGKRRRRSFYGKTREEAVANALARRAEWDRP